MYSPSLDGKYSIGDSIIVNTGNGSVEVDGAPVKLRRQLYLSLLLLMENRLNDAYVPYDDFSKTIPEGKAVVGDSISNESVRKNVSDLNSKLKSKLIVPFKGLGYYLVPDVRKTDSQPQTEASDSDQQEEIAEMVRKLHSLINDLPDILEKTCTLHYQRNLLLQPSTISTTYSENVLPRAFNLHSLEDPSSPRLEGEYKPGDVVLSHWKLTHMIGSGSMASVYEGVREEYGFTQKAAIKIIRFHPPAGDNDTQEMGIPLDYFPTAYREVTSLEALRGRTNITCYEDHEVIELATGGRDLIIRMELLKPISDILLENPIQQEDVVRLGIDICKALETCHSLGIVHRDVKPANIYLSPWGDFKLGDFGASSAVSSLSDSDRIFTPQYAAPEVIRGGSYSSNIDTYSLGLVMYYLLNGRRYPFLSQDQYPPSADARNLALSRRLAGEQLPKIPKVKPRLQNVVLKACAFRPKNRFQTAAEMRKALEKLR